MIKDFPPFFAKKEKKTSPKKKKKEHKGQKKGQKPRYFSFFQGETISTQSFLPDARALSATRLWCANTRTHKLLLCVEFVRKKRYATRRCLFFARVLVASLSRPSARAYRFLESALSFLSKRERQKKREEHQTHRFGISNSREKKEETHKTRREENQDASPPPSRATKGTSRVFFVVPPSALFLSLLARESWSVAKGFFVGKKRERSLGEGGRESESPLRKRRQKRRQKRTV